MTDAADTRDGAAPDRADVARQTGHADGADADIRALSGALRQGIGRVRRRLIALRAQGELGDAAVSVLSRIRKLGPMSLTALSEDARVTPASMSQAVNRLAAGDYLTREPDPSDGRRVLFTLTEAGRRAEAVSTARGVAWLEAHLAAATPEDRAVLARAAELLNGIADD